LAGQTPNKLSRVRRSSAARKSVVCILSAHPLVLPELQRYLTPLRFHTVGRQLELDYTRELHAIPLPVASVYVVDGHSMGGAATESLVSGIRYRYRKRHVVVLVEETEGMHCFPLLRLGVKGLIRYKDVEAQLVPAVQAIADGGFWVPRDLMSRYLELGQTIQTAQVPVTASKSLSRREREVLDYLLKNFSNKEIANALNISESTVKFHVSNVISRFGVRRRADLILRFLPETTSVH
jgi:DNA-binding NarL/FixJ family response regulator